MQGLMKFWSVFLCAFFKDNATVSICKWHSALTEMSLGNWNQFEKCYRFLSELVNAALRLSYSSSGVSAASCQPGGGGGGQ